MVTASTFLVFLPAIKGDFVQLGRSEMVIFNPRPTAWAGITSRTRSRPPGSGTTTRSPGCRSSSTIRSGPEPPRISPHQCGPARPDRGGGLPAGAGTFCGAPRGEGGFAIDAAAAVGALAFAVHPLRVEAVAWVTARRDVLSGLFFFVTLLVYVRAIEAPRDRTDAGYRRGMALALVAYVAALLSKSITMTLPAVLVILDAYPLRRRLRERSVWLEKLPFALLGAAAAVRAVWAVTRGELTDEGPAQRLAMAGYSLAFYVWKTVLPVGLSRCTSCQSPWIPTSFPSSRAPPLPWPALWRRLPGDGGCRGSRPPGRTTS